MKNVENMLVEKYVGGWQGGAYPCLSPKRVSEIDAHGAAKATFGWGEVQGARFG